MATNLEIYALRTNADLLKRLEVAVARYATYIRGNDNATPQEREWARRVFELGQSSTITQSLAWEAVNDPIIRDAVDVSLTPDTGAGSIQVVVELIALKYGGDLPQVVQGA